MATRNKTYLPVTPKLLTSFKIPEGFPALGIAPVDENKAWILPLNLPMVLLIDTTGHVHQTGYAVKELKRIREKTSMDIMLDAVRDKCLEGQCIATDNSGGCLLLTTEPRQTSIHHINKSGAVSTVISGLDLMNIDGIAYLSESAEKGLVLFGDVSKGICSLKWPRSWLAGLFSTPVDDVLFTEAKCLISSCAVDKKSDLICAGTLQNKIIVINKKGQKLSEYRSTPEDTETFFNQTASFDHTGCIIVHNRINSHVFRLSPEGQVIQTIFEEISEDAKICEECKKLEAPPFCKECKDKVRITAVGMYEDLMWVCRSTRIMEIYRLL